MKNEGIKSIIVLAAIALVVMVALAGINMVTKDRIAENERLAILESLEKMNEENKDLNAPLENYDEIARPVLEALVPENTLSSIEKVFKDRVNGGYAFIFTAKSSFSSSPMKYSVYIDSEGKIAAIQKINYMESKNFGDSFPNNFLGKNESESDSFDVASLKTGATYSAKAFKTGINAALDTFRILSENENQ